MLSGKAGIVNVHIGDGGDRLQPLLAVAESSEIPLRQFLPTHINRNPELFEQGIAYANGGRYVDFTTSATEAFLQEGEVKCSRALSEMLDASVPLPQITFSSDAQGSLPNFDDNGEFVGLQVGKVASLYPEVRDAASGSFPLEVALQTITSNPARILRLSHKGRIVAGCSADVVLLQRETLRITEVFARGRKMVADSEPAVKGTFEYERSVTIVRWLR